MEEGVHLLETLKNPTFYFIGVSTAKSRIMNVFPLWVKKLGLPQTDIRGHDIEIHGKPEKYREIVQHIKDDKNGLGACVTTHKIDLVRNAGDLFDYLDPYAQIFGEVSSISKRGVMLRGHAKDPISSGLALEAFLPANYWLDYPGAQVFIMGAGGSGVALSAYLMREDHGANVPEKIIISNRREGPLEHCRNVHKRLGRMVEVEYRQIQRGITNDSILSELPEGSLIVNATGMGKDRPGSPLSNSAVFPIGGYVWEFNYRGSLHFLRQAEHQEKSRNLVLEDGWRYFIYGWTQVIGEVFHIDINDSELEELCWIARGV
jgi:shikimate 5-dehydrogenase